MGVVLPTNQAEPPEELAWAGGWDGAHVSPPSLWLLVRSRAATTVPPRACVPSHPPPGLHPPHACPSRRVDNNHLLLLMIHVFRENEEQLFKVSPRSSGARGKSALARAGGGSRGA